MHRDRARWNRHRVGCPVRGPAGALLRSAGNHRNDESTPEGHQLRRTHGAMLRGLSPLIRRNPMPGAAAGGGVRVQAAGLTGSGEVSA